MRNKKGNRVKIQRQHEMSVFKYFASSSSDSGLDDKDICRMPPLERAIRHCCTSRSWSGSRYTGKL